MAADQVVPEFVLLNDSHLEVAERTAMVWCSVLQRMGSSLRVCRVSFVDLLTSLCQLVFTPGSGFWLLQLSVGARTALWASTACSACSVCWPLLLALYAQCVGLYCLLCMLNVSASTACSVCSMCWPLPLPVLVTRCAQ